MWVLTKTGNKWVNSNLNVANKPNEGMQILSWGQDEAGEVYLLVSSSNGSGGKGSVYKLVK
jgi:hypothetical protein